MKRSEHDDAITGMRPFTRALAAVPGVLAKFDTAPQRRQLCSQCAGTQASGLIRDANQQPVIDSCIQRRRDRRNIFITENAGHGDRASAAGPLGKGRR